MERLAARAQRLVDLGCSRVVILEATGSFGDGRIHSATQVRTSALNRVASQVGFGADEALLGAPLLPVALRPTLAEWLERGASAAPEDPEAPPGSVGHPNPGNPRGGAPLLLRLLRGLPAGPRDHRAPAHWDGNRRHPDGLGRRGDVD